MKKHKTNLAFFLRTLNTRFYHPVKYVSVILPQAKGLVIFPVMVSLFFATSLRPCFLLAQSPNQTLSVDSATAQDAAKAPLGDSSAAGSQPVQNDSRYDDTNIDETFCRGYSEAIFYLSDKIRYLSSPLTKSFLGAMTARNPQSIIDFWYGQSPVVETKSLVGPKVLASPVGFANQYRARVKILMSLVALQKAMNLTEKEWVCAGSGIDGTPVIWSFKYPIVEKLSQDFFKGLYYYELLLLSIVEGEGLVQVGAAAGAGGERYSPLQVSWKQLRELLRSTTDADALLLKKMQ